MQACRTTISETVLVSAALAAAFVLASGPAASPRTAARPLVTGPAARTVAPSEIEAVRGFWSQLSGGKGSATISARALGIEAYRPHAARGGRVRVVIESESPAHARAAVVASGGRVERTAPGLVQALVSPTTLAALAERPGVGRVRAPYSRIENAVSGEEVGVALASAWHEKGFTGKGVKVAIIDGGFAGLADRQSSGDLPGNAITQDYCGGKLGSDGHGTAVAEIVHEMAPDAKLHLICVGTEVDLAAAVAYAKSQDVAVVNHSVGWEGPHRDDGTDPIGAIVSDARANGILWVNAAGNEAQTHWSGTYVPAGPPVHRWDPNGDVGNSFIWPNDSAICGFLKWDEWPAAASDFDLALVLSGANRLIAISEEEQGNGEAPYEELCLHQDSGQDLIVFWAIVGYNVVSSPRIDLISWSPPLQYQVAAGSIATPASSPAALAVGALCWQSRSLEPYSSQGPTIDGRVKPDIVGHDSVSGSTYGPFAACPSAFAGTSASAPEVAGAAALVKQAYPTYAPDRIKAYLMTAARDLGAPRLDNVYGAGELQLPKPPDVVAPTVTALPGTARRGHMARLQSRISDDSGEVGVLEEIKLHGRVVARLKPVWFSTAVRARTVAVRWKVPAGASGTYQHCVRAVDRAGNATARSCARIRTK
ncbi:MAG TPA: S8 family serine peptidase [Gaiellaceae bacterium]|nr:S8 family serine peptidase [Gaiellaceae bacterium]